MSRALNLAIFVVLLAFPLLKVSSAAQIATGPSSGPNCVLDFLQVPQNAPFLVYEKSPYNFELVVPVKGEIIIQSGNVIGAVCTNAKGKMLKNTVSSHFTRIISRNSREQILQSEMHQRTVHEGAARRLELSADCITKSSL